jgi:hypothetical protein
MFAQTPRDWMHGLTNDWRKLLGAAALAAILVLGAFVCGQ